MIGDATRLDPLPTTFDHPKRILRPEVRCVNRLVVVLFTDSCEGGGYSRSPLVCLPFQRDSLPILRYIISLRSNDVVYFRDS